MSAGVMVKQFLIDTTKTVGQTFDVTDANILAQPVAVLFFANGQTGSHTGGGNASANRMIGWAAATTEGNGLQNFSATERSLNGSSSAAGENGFLSGLSCLCTLTGIFGGGAAVIDGRAHVSSFLSNGFRFTIDEQFSLQLSVMAYVIWGTDFTNIEMVSRQSLDVGTTPLDEDIALPFVCTDKNAIIFAAGTRETDINTQHPDSDLCFGAAVSAAEQCCFASGGDDALALPSPGTEVRRHADMDQLFVGFNPTKSGFSIRSAFASWLGTGGFKLTWKQITATDVNINYLVIKGGQWSIKSGTAPASGTVDVTGAGFNPLAAIVVSHGAAAFNADTAHSPDMQDSFGAFDASRNAGYTVRNLTDQTTATLVATQVAPTTSVHEITTAGAVNTAMSGQPISDGVRMTVVVGNPNTHLFAVIMTGANAAAGGAGPAEPDRIVVANQRAVRARRW